MFHFIVNIAFYAVNCEMIVSSFSSSLRSSELSSHIFATWSHSHLMSDQSYESRRQTDLTYWSWHLSVLEFAKMAKTEQISTALALQLRVSFREKMCIAHRRILNIFRLYVTRQLFTERRQKNSLHFLFLLRLLFFVVRHIAVSSHLQCHEFTMRIYDLSCSIQGLCRDDQSVILKLKRLDEVWEDISLQAQDSRSKKQEARNISDLQID